MATKPRHSGDSPAIPAAGPDLRAHCAPWPAFADAIARWDALAAVASEPNPFLESWYLLPALEAFDPAGTVHLFTLERDGEIAGLMPVARFPRYYRWPVPHLANWTHANAFLGTPLVARGCEVSFWRALLDWADREAGRALFLHLRDIALGGPLHAALEAVTAGSPRTCALVHREERALLEAGRNAEAYWEASLSAKKRKELRRQLKRLGEEGELRTVRAHDAQGLETWTEAFLALEQAGWKGAAGSALACDPRTAALFRRALAGAAQRGRLERLSLTLDGRPIAMLATFLTPPGSFSFKTAFDERLSRFSPGVLLQQENLALLERDGIAWCDSCASADHPMIDHIWRERRAVGRFSIAIGGALRRAAFTRLARAESGRAKPKLPEGAGA